MVQFVGLVAYYNYLNKKSYLYDKLNGNAF